ncbi:trypsin-like peptidase domain-containing protein [Streptomyces sp. NPDC020875]|uniref:S1C family serine protease n=1 Tax=Streptomyces sp. NPDC020875 TaxID=3154898 RepID=UPI0033E2B53B
MDDGKPTGPKAAWWSRAGSRRRAEAAAETGAAPGHAAPPGQPPAPPAVPPVPPPTTPTGPAAHGAADEPGHGTNGATGAVPPPPVPGPAPVPPAEHTPARPTPLHAPDEYSTPPYGGPGPWAPAPPVQRPVPTPAHGTYVPPAYPAPPGTAPAATPPNDPRTATGTHPAAHPPTGAHPTGAHPTGPHATDGTGFAAPPTSPVDTATDTGTTGPGTPPGGPYPASQWLHYDPWAATGGSGGTPAAPLAYTGGPARRRGGRGPLIAGAVLLALVSGVVGGGIGSYVERTGGFGTDRIELDQAPKESRDRAPDSVAGIAARALPGVVTLHVAGGGEQGTGTGFVLDEQGHILTNNHVVDPAGSSGEISVTFSGGETARATLVGKDSGYDLAVVKVTGVAGLTPLPLGNSDNVRVGDPVVAIGAPFDLQNTVTSGIISAKERPITAGGEKGDGTDISYVDALQTDAPINPGNSGGPLMDTKARVIGINSAIRAADGGGGGPEAGQSGSIGLGFAIPVNQGKRVAEELINTGKATHPVIGVNLDMRYTGAGARVSEKNKDGSATVVPDGPAAKAGIRPGDVITEVDGRKVYGGEELIVKIRAHRPGDELELTVERDGREEKKKLRLGSSEGD